MSEYYSSTSLLVALLNSDFLDAMSEELKLVTFNNFLPLDLCQRWDLSETKYDFVFHIPKLMEE